MEEVFPLINIFLILILFFIIIVISFKLIIRIFLHKYIKLKIFITTFYPTLKLTNYTSFYSHIFPIYPKNHDFRIHFISFTL
jgi:hypothetical protein